MTLQYTHGDSVPECTTLAFALHIDVGGSGIWRINLGHTKHRKGPLKTRKERSVTMVVSQLLKQTSTSV